MMTRLAQLLTIRRPFIVCTLLTSAALLACPVFADDATKEEDLKAEIVHRCHYQMGEFGPEGVHVCVDGEMSAMKALSAYPREAAEIVRRCTRQVEFTGWWLAKSCADEEIAAAREMKKD